jgi:phage host-nuclease inhibitor protein Gam
LRWSVHDHLAWALLAHRGKTKKACFTAGLCKHRYHSP